MLPTPTLRPVYHAPRCLVIGAVVAGVWFCPAGQAWALLSGSMEVGTHGESLWQEMPRRCIRTLALVVLATSFAASFGTLAAFVAASLGLWPARLLTWLGQWLAAVPVIGAAWCGMAWLVNEHRLPVESLIPYAPPVELDTWGMALGRTLYAWAVPFWLLALPLTGLWMSELAERLRLHWPVPNAVALSARGVRGVHLRWGYWLRMAWMPLVDRWLRLSLIGLGFSIGVEGVFGLQGWGGFVAGTVGGPESHLAAAIYTGGWMMAALCVLAQAVEGWRRRSVSGDEGREQKNSMRHAPPSAGTLVAAWLTPLLLVLLAVRPAPAGWMKALLGPWLESLLPAGWVDPVNGHLPALLADAGLASQIALQAGVLSVVVGTVAWIVRRAPVRPLPRFEWLTGLAWSPLLLLAWFLPPETGAWTSIVMIVAVADGAAVWRGHCLELELCGHGQASKAMGLLVGRSVWRHGRSLLLPWLAGWMLRVAGSVVVWRVFAASAQTLTAKLRVADAGSPGSLGGHIAAARAAILSDVEPMLWPAVLTSLVVWGFWRLGSVASATRPAHE